MDREAMTYTQPVEDHEREIAEMPEDPAPWRETYDLDWPMIVFWTGYLCVLALMTVCAGWDWLWEKVGP